MKLILDLAVRYPDFSTLMASDPAKLDALLAKLGADDILRKFRYFGKWNKLKKFTPGSTQKIVEQLARGQSLYFSDNPNPNLPDEPYEVSLYFNVRRITASFQLIVNHLEAVDIQPMIHRMLGFVRAVMEVYGSEIQLNNGTMIFIPGFEYPCIRPPRRMAGLHYYPHALVEIVHPRFAGEDDEAGIYDALLNADLPNGATRTPLGENSVIHWLEKVNIQTEEDVAAVLTGKERWCYANANFPAYEVDWNELGDQRLVIAETSGTAYFTTYFVLAGYGFKAVVVGEDGSYDVSTFDELKQWLDAGKAPDGIPVHLIGLILPNRELCFKIRPVALRYGFYYTIYQHHNGMLYDPFPPGRWAKTEILP